MELKYECSNGTIIDLMKKPIFAQSPETLLKTSWSYNSISAINNRNKIKNFFKDLHQSSLQLSIMTNTKEEFNDTMNLLFRSFDRDVKTLKPGKIWWNDFYKEVFIISPVPSDFEELFESVEIDLDIIFPYSFWIRKEKHRFPAVTEAAGSLDYPYDFSFDFGCPNSQETFMNDCICDADFELVLYGPITNPCVTINGHDYEILTTLEQGEYAVVNSNERTITQFSVTGEAKSIFNLRNKESEIFEKIPEGLCFVSRNSHMGFDIIIYNEWGAPKTWI